MKLIISLLTVVFSQLTFAQSYVITNPQGYVSQNIQIQGNQVTVTNPQGYVIQQGTIYPNQVVTPQGYAVGVPSYTIPITPPSPPSPRILQ